MKRNSIVKSYGHPIVRVLAIAWLAICSVVILQSSVAIASTSALKTVTTDDKTASVGIPSGWTLLKGVNGFIAVTGPNSEAVSLGALVVAKNASAGSSVNGEVAFALPFNASLAEKFTTIMQTGAAKQGVPVPQITVASVTQMKLPMCSRLLGGWTAGGKSTKFEGIICSLQPDYLGLYKNLVFLAQVPASLAAQDRSTVEQIAQSYRVTPAMFKRMLAPYTPLPPRPVVGAMPMAPYQDPTNSDCFDYNVIRESPPWEVPMHCGGTQPG
jgi:hypothetical protein